MVCKTCLISKAKKNKKNLAILSILLMSAELSFYFGNDVSMSSLMIGFGAIAGGSVVSGIASIAGDAVVMTHSETIGDYETPSNAVGTSEATDTSADAMDSTTRTSANSGASTSNAVAYSVDFNDYTFPTDDFEARIPLDVTAFTARTDTNSQYTFIGFSSTNGAPNTNADRLGVFLRTHSSVGHKFYASGSDAGAVGSLLSSALSGYDLQSGLVYVKLALESTNTFSIYLYSDSGYSTLLGSVSLDITANTIESLRYFIVTTTRSVTTNNGVIDTSIGSINRQSGISITRVDEFLFDDDTSTLWQSNAEVNPACYVDLGSTKNICGVALYVHANMSETQIAIRTDGDTTFSSSENRRLVDLTDLTAGAWNYIRFNVQAHRYLQIYGNSGTSKVLAFNEIKVMTKTDAQMKLNHGHFVIDATDNTLGLNGV